MACVKTFIKMSIVLVSVFMVAVCKKLSFFKTDSEGFFGDQDFDDTSADDGLSHIQKMEKFMSSENIYNRFVNVLLFNTDDCSLLISWVCCCFNTYYCVVFHRQVCARNLPDSIRLLRDENKDVEHVMKVLVKLAEDSGTVQHGVYSYISC